MIGGGEPDPSTDYRFIHAGHVPRERFEQWPAFPPFRRNYVYEELTYALNLYRVYRPEDYDVTVTCSYPFTNWALRLGRRGKRPKHVFVTENGDWAPRRMNAEYKAFSCDGLICTNSEYYDRHRETWPSVQIPNGVDVDHFSPGPAQEELACFRDELPVVLIVAALIPSKRVMEGLEALAELEGVNVLVAGDGPLASQVDELGRSRLGDRYLRIVVSYAQMPDVYRAADMLLHMSRDEPFGNIYIEALAMGLPVVAHETSNTRWIFGELAELVDTSQATETRAAVRRALSARSEPEARERREAAEQRYAWEAVADQYCAFFKSICEPVE